jgi:large subunit ribosomal protein L19
MSASKVKAIKEIKFTPVDIEARKKLDFRAGDTIRVWSKIPEEKAAKKGAANKFRLQAFEGIVLARKHGAENGATFTVRKVASGVGVERIFPLYSPMVDKIEVTKKSRARRSKLYYVRVKAVKDVRRKMRSVTNEVESEAETPVEEKTAE